MKNTRHGITVDEAYKSSIGEFGRGQKLIFTLVQQFNQYLKLTNHR